MYDGVLNGINYKHFVLEMTNIAGPQYDSQYLYDDIVSGNLSKKEFIERALDGNPGRSSLYSRIKTMEWNAEPDEPIPFNEEEMEF